MKGQDSSDKVKTLITTHFV